MIIDLKRWTPCGRKNKTKVSVELTDIDFSQYVKGYDSKSYIYELYGIANHSGEAEGGVAHYTATIKNANGCWYEFDDTFVRMIKDENSIVSQKSYCFFFRKKK